MHHLQQAGSITASIHWKSAFLEKQNKSCFGRRRRFFVRAAAMFVLPVGIYRNELIQSSTRYKHSRGPSCDMTSG